MKRETKRFLWRGVETMKFFSSRGERSGGFCEQGRRETKKFLWRGEERREESVHNVIFPNRIEPVKTSLHSSYIGRKIVG